jgi:hypothetical protein
VRLFFHVHTPWDWDADVVAVLIPGMHMMEGSQYQYRRSKCQLTVVLSVEKLGVNTTANANPNTVGVLKGVLAAADHVLERGVRGAVGEMGETNAGWAVYGALGIRYWGSSCGKGRGVAGESVSPLSPFFSGWDAFLRIFVTKLLVQLHANAPIVRAHMWPARLADGECG